MDGAELLAQLRQVLTVAGADDGVGNVADALYDIDEKLDNISGKLADGDRVTDNLDTIAQHLGQISTSEISGELTKVMVEIDQLRQSIVTSAHVIGDAIADLTKEIKLARTQQRPKR